MSEPLSTGQAILLGVIQGVTEFLPVSSSGHLALAEAYLGIQGGGVAVAALLHAGTLLAILLVFPGPTRRVLNGVWQLVRHPRPGRRGHSEDAILAGQVACATLPGAVAGLALADRIEAAFGDSQTVAISLLVTAGALLATRKVRPRREMTWGAAWTVGLVQACAILPGISRSGATIAAAVLVGVSRPRAAEFSFLAAMPLILGSVLISIPGLEADGAGATGPLMLGFVVSFLIGWGALSWLIQLVRRGQLHWFAFYCAALAVVVFVWPPL